jgi:hypothetical protein
MVVIERVANGDAMDQSLTDIAATAHQLQRAAGQLQQRASGPETVAALPVTLAHLEEALERISTSTAKMAQAVEEWAAGCDEQVDNDTIAPQARALRWHLFHLGSRLRGAQDACPDARRWARTMLSECSHEDEGAASLTPSA